VGGLEASEGPSGPPEGLKHDLEQKGSPKYLRGYRFKVTLPLNVDHKSGAQRTPACPQCSGAFDAHFLVNGHPMLL
jgi:hypothetical protein